MWSDDKGVSLILANSPKGERIVASLSEIMDLVRCDAAECIQPQLQHPCPANPNHEVFAKDYVSKGFVYCGKKIGAIGYKNKLFRFKQKIRETNLYKKIKGIL